MKYKIIIWGGNKKPLALENLDSHASVSAFFLTKYLSKYYEIINLVDMDSPEDILNYQDIYVVISTFQKGFTNRLMLKGKEDLFFEIRKHIRGKLCSIYDYNDDGKYYEDVIFTVRPPQIKNKRIIKKKSFNPDMVIYELGWCADPDICYPIQISKDEINIFIDHPPYSSKGPDCTIEYYKAFKKIRQEYPEIKLKVYQQNNQGITRWDFTDNSMLDKSLYVRENKVPWLKIIEYYKKMHIFCITHPESACLSAIEAAMCGAKLYVPKYRWNRTFISNDLLSENISYSTFRCNSNDIFSTFENDFKKGFNRKKIHSELSKTNSWRCAAERVYKI